jgi:tRNA-Thr(GGU) m(6)t(6)A37 methyltransferase TsaA
VRYAAIGDSFTEGVGDELPDGSTRGWADRVAAGLAAARGEPVLHANLAVRGRRLEPIVTDQLDAALALDPAPTLLTFNGGGNDLLRPRTDVARLVDLTARAVHRCAAAGVRLVLVSGADPGDRIPLGRAVRRRGEELAAGVAELARRHGVVFVDVFHDAQVRRPAHWAPDRLHLGPAGHRRVAGLVLAALGEGAAAEAVQEDAPEVRRLLAELRYYRDHVLPWVGRRLRGRSSGDGRTGKHPLWVPVQPGPGSPDREPGSPDREPGSPDDESGLPDRESGSRHRGSDTPARGPGSPDPCRGPADHEPGPTGRGAGSDGGGSGSTASAAGDVEPGTADREPGRPDREPVVPAGAPGAPDPVLRPVGRVASPLIDPASAPKQGDEGAPDAWLELDPSVAPALRGVEPGAELVVLTWLHLARRDVLLTHPRGDRTRPEAGVFATRSPHRPNPVGLHTVRVLAVEGARVRVRGLEALDGTPVLDLKPVLGPPGER